MDFFFLLSVHGLCVVCICRCVCVCVCTRVCCPSDAVHGERQEGKTSIWGQNEARGEAEMLSSTASLLSLGLVACFSAFLGCY